MLRMLVLCLLSVCCNLANAYAVIDTDSTARFMSIADIHFNPLAACQTIPCELALQLQKESASKWRETLRNTDHTQTRYREDTNFPLLTLTLAGAGRMAVQEKTKFTLILGDFVAHDMRTLYRKYTGDVSSGGFQAFISKLFIFLNDEIKSAFPQQNVYAIVGNNDTFQGDYHLTPGGEFFKQAGQEWAKLSTTNSGSISTQISKAGYYAITIPDEPKIRLIGLNSVLFSKHARRSVSSAAQEELNWLTNELRVTVRNQQKALIALHIPPAYDIYALPRMRLFSLISLWKPVYIQAFNVIIKTFAPNIFALCAGHLHTNYLHYLRFSNAKGEIIILGAPAISPITGTNPAFNIYTYNPKTLKLLQSKTYFHSLEGRDVWQIQTSNIA